MHSLIFHSYTWECHQCHWQQFRLPRRRRVPPLVDSPLPAQPLVDPRLASPPENVDAWNHMPVFIVGLASCMQRSALETCLPFSHNSQGLPFRTDQQYSPVQMHPRSSAKLLFGHLNSLWPHWAVRRAGCEPYGSTFRGELWNWLHALSPWSCSCCCAPWFGAEMPSSWGTH